MFVFVCFCLSIFLLAFLCVIFFLFRCLPNSVPVFLIFCKPLPVKRPAYLFVSLSVSVCLCQPASLPVCLNNLCPCVFLFICLLTYLLSSCPSINLINIYIYIHICVYVSVCVCAYIQTCFTFAVLFVS